MPLKDRLNTFYCLSSANIAISAGHGDLDTCRLQDNKDPCMTTFQIRLSPSPCSTAATFRLFQILSVAQAVPDLQEILTVNHLYPRATPDQLEEATTIRQ